MTSNGKPVRAYASDVQFTFLGLMSLGCDLLPLIRSDGGNASKAASFKTICPGCDTPTPIPQSYVCATHGSFSVSELHRAREVDGVLHRVSEEEVEAVKAPLIPEGQANVHLFPAESIDAATRPGTKGYLLRPAKGKRKQVPDQQMWLYSALVDEISGDPQVAWVTEVAARKSQSMFRIVVWNGNLALQELVRPSELNEFPAQTVGYDSRLLAGLKQAVSGAVEDFDPAKFALFYRDRAQALDDAKRTGTPVEAAVVQVAAADDGGIDAMLSMLGSMNTEV